VASTVTEWLATAELDLSAHDVRFELRDTDGNRRLHDLLRQERGPNDGDDDTPIRVAPSTSDPDVRYRYVTDPSLRAGGERVRRFDRYACEVTELRGESLQPEYTFEIEFENTDDRPADLSDESSISVPLSTLDSCDRTREFRVAGLDSEREAVMEFLDSSGDRWGLSTEHGLLLEGPPGTGKTEVVMEVCRELYGSVPVEVSGPEILSRWVGESERTLRERFEDAREDPSNVLYIDELDSIARSRGQSTQEYSTQIVAQLLVLLDGIESKRGEEPVKVVASTNMAGMVDEALRRPGRLGRTQSFDTLGETDAIAVLHHYLDEIRRHTEPEGVRGLSDPLRRFVETGSPEEFSGNERTFEGLRSVLSGRTGADIEQVVQRATRIVDDEGQESVNDHLGVEELHRAATESVRSDRMVEPIEGDPEPNSPTFAPEQPVVRMAPERGRDGVLDAFGRFLDTHDYERGEFREFVLTEEDALSDPSVVRTRLREQFSPDERHPVCVYVRDFSKIDRASSHSPVAEIVVETVCDCLVAPTPLPEGAPPAFFGYMAAPDTDLPRLDQIATDPRPPTQQRIDE
jgi:transitional endoplasmic reticulum ATPase